MSDAREWTTGNLKRLEEMARNGYTVAEAAREFGVKKSAIYHINSVYGIRFMRNGLRIELAMRRGNPFFEARFRAGLSQPEAAEEIGISDKTIMYWEMGVNKPHPANLKRAAQVYKTTVGQLLGETVIDNKELDDMSGYFRIPPQVRGRMRAARERVHLSQMDAADLIGVNTQMIYLWEAGSSVPNLEHLKKAAQAYGVTPGWLIGTEIMEVDSDGDADRGQAR